MPCCGGRLTPPWVAFGVFVLAFLLVITAAGLAFYESRTRRLTTIKPVVTVEPARSSLNDLDVPLLTENSTISGTVVEPTRAELDVKPETILRQPIAENPATPRALDGGEPF